MSKGKRVAKRNKMGAGKLAVTIVIVVVLLIACAVCAFGVYANGRDTIYPGVDINGIDVGGMTKEQAAIALADAELSQNGNESVKVSFSEGELLEISRSEAGLDPTPVEAVDRAYECGRNGGFFGNAISYLKCAVFGESIETSDIVSIIDEEAVRAKIKETADRINSSAIESAYRIEDDKLIITKGVSSVEVSVDDVYDIVVDAFLNENYDVIEYEPSSAAESSIDIDAIYEAVCTEPVPASYDKETGVVTEGIPGVQFDKDEAMRLFNEAEMGSDVYVPLTITQPEVDKDALEGALFQNVLAEKSTSMSTSTANRINNITLAAKAINGSIFMPGEEFSFNGIVGQRTAAKGYKEAGAYVGGQSVDEIGGGICQVSSTIYYCTLLADLEITARSNHMFPVAYLPLGLDATVNWNNIDFKFKNNKDYPIKLVAYVEGKQLYVQILGTKTDDTKIELTYEVVSTINYDTVEEVDTSLAPGQSTVKTSGLTGYVVNSYMKKYGADGKLLSSDLIAKSTYRKRDKVVLVGPEATPTPTPEASPSPGESPAPEVTPTPTPPDQPVNSEVTPSPTPDIQQPEVTPPPETIPDVPENPATPDEPVEI